jgi:hypothetical protein
LLLLLGENGGFGVRHKTIVKYDANIRHK